MASRMSFLFMLCVLPALIYAACYSDLIKDMPGPRGLRVPYCEYNGQKYAIGTHFEDLVRCNQVDCEKSGLSVCGTGVGAGVFLLPEGCKTVNDVCRLRIIQDPSTNTSCPISTPVPSQ